MATTVAEKLRIESVLSKPCYASIHALLGPLITERGEAVVPDCHLLRLLAEDNESILRLWEQPCSKYIRVVQSLPAAVAKIMLELTGPARKLSPAGFNARLGDFFAEIAVVAELSGRGCHEFVPLIPLKKGSGGTTSAVDYSCIINVDQRHSDSATRQEIAYLEVKNLRAPVGINDVFSTVWARLSSAQPALSKFRFVLGHHWDNTVTEDQSEAIDEFLTAFAANPFAQRRMLALPEAGDVEVQTIEEPGGVSMMRAVGGDHLWGPFVDESKFFDKATSSIHKGIVQLSNYPNSTRLLALNVQTLDATFPNNWGLRLQKLVRRESNGAVQCLLFFFNRFIEL